MSPVDLLIQSKLIGDGFEKAKSEMSGMAGAAAKLGAAIQAGIGIDIGRRLVEIAQSVPRALASAVQVGIQFNATIQQNQIAFSTLLGSMGQAQARMADLATFAAKTPFELPEIVRASKVLQALGGTAIASGVGLRLVGDAAAAAGRNFEETAMWIGRLYGGLQSGTPVGEATMRLLEMGLVSGETKRKLDALAQSGEGMGRAMGIVSETFLKTSGAMEAQSESFNGQLSTLRDNLTQFFGEQTKGAFEALTGALKKINEILASESFRRGVENLRTVILISGGLAAAAVAVGGVAAAILSFNIAATTAFGAVAIGSVTAFVSQLSLIGAATVGPLGLTAAAIIGVASVVGLAAAAWGKYKAEQEAALNAERLADQHLALAQAINRVIESKLRAGEIDDAEADRLRTKLALINQISEAEQRHANLIGLGRDLRGAKEVQPGPPPRERTEAETKLADEYLKRWREAILSKRDLLEIEYAEEIERIQLGLKSQEDQRAALKQLDEIYAAKRKTLRTEELDKFSKDLDEELDKIADSEEKKLALHRKTLAAQLQADGDSLRAYRDGITLERALMDADFRTPENAKRGPRLELLQLESTALDEVIRRQKQKRALETDAAAKETIENQIRALEAEKRGIDKEAASLRSGPNPESFRDQFASVLTDLENQFGSWASQMAHAFESVFNQAIGTISNGIMGLIKGTVTWGQALRNIGTTILTSVIEAIVQMGVRWLLTQVMIATVGKALALSSVAATAPIAAAQAAVWATPATLATIASFGGAAAAAPGLIAAAQGVTLASALAGFEKGGYTGDGGTSQVAGLVHKKEFVFNAPAVQRIGRGNLEAMQAGRAGSYPNGGGPNISVAAAPVQVAILNDRRAARDWVESLEGRRVIIDVVRGAKVELGLPT